MRHARVSTADVLRQAIRSSGMSVNALAKSVGMTQPRLCEFVNGRRDLSMRNADRLMDYFGLELVARRSRQR